MERRVLEGRVALVTGASRGIGRAVAERLAQAGADVAVGYGGGRDAAEEVAERVRGLGVRAAAVGGDLAEPARVSAFVDEAEAELGPVDVLVSNAAIGPHRALEDVTVEEWDRVMETNVRPAFLLAQRLAPGMRERGWAASCWCPPWPPSRAASSGRTTRPRRPRCSG